MKRHFSMMAAYNRWANVRLYDMAAAMPDELYRKPIDIYFKNLHGTLNHILTAERIGCIGWLFQAASAIFTPFYQSDSRVLPIVRDWLSSPLSRLPIGDAILARLVCGMTVSPLMKNKFTVFRS